MGPDDGRAFQKQVHEELKEIKSDVRALNSQFTQMRISMALAQKQLSDGEKKDHRIWGLIGGAISSVIISIILYFLKLSFPK